jgi:outer membrane protein assembly factor BamE (lipoprotein component of BamABCDE complex)
MGMDGRRNRWGWEWWAVAALAAAIALAGWHTLAVRFQFGPEYAKFNRINVNMTKAEVESILGRPTCSAHPGGIVGEHIYRYEDGPHAIVVTYEMDDEHVFSKRFVRNAPPPSPYAFDPVLWESK